MLGGKPFACLARRVRAEREMMMMYGDTLPTTDFHNENKIGVPKDSKQLTKPCVYIHFVDLYHDDDTTHCIQ